MEGGHLAIFARSLSGGGGVERVILHLADALAERGHRVDLVLARSKGRFVSEIPDGVRLVDLEAPPAPLALPSLLRVPASIPVLFPALFVPGVAQVLGAVPALAGYLRRERPAAILAALDYANVTALVARRLAGVPVRVVVTVHNHLSQSVANADRPHLRWVPHLVKHFYPEADAVVTVSHGLAQDLAKVAGLPEASITTVYNPVLTPAIAKRAAEPIEHPWFEPGSPPVLLGVGKLKRQKDFETLLRAFARVRERRPARLMILGDGPRHTSLLRLARDLGVAGDVALPGFVGNPYAYMSRAALLVLSSAWEGFGNVLVEAMSCGCPVVSTDCASGPAEILQDGRYGPLVPVGDTDALANAIAATLDESLAPEKLKERAGEFTAAASAAQYERLLFGPPRAESAAA